MDGLDTFTVVTVAIMVIAGAGFVGGGMWQLRRGPVTAREAVTWRHSMRRRHIIDPQDEMPPRLTDAFVLAWRRYWAGFLLGIGIGLIADAIAYLAIAIASPSTDYDSRSLARVAFGLTLLSGISIGAALGTTWGFSTMRRETNSTRPRRTIGDYRLWLVPALLVAVVLGTGAFAAYAASQVLSLPPRTGDPFDSPASPFVLVVAPIWLLVVTIIVEVAVHHIAALPPPATPLESPLAAPFDEKLKSLALFSTYMALGICVLMGCSNIADYPLNVVMGETFNDQANAAAMLILACFLPYIILVSTGPHPIQRYREWRAQRVSSEAT